VFKASRCATDSLNQWTDRSVSSSRGRQLVEATRVGISEGVTVLDADADDGIPWLATAASQPLSVMMEMKK
jgi:hypothetical protein